MPVQRTVELEQVALVSASRYLGRFRHRKCVKSTRMNVAIVAFATSTILEAR